MKRWISTILSISIVVSMAAVLHACGKPKDDAETTTEEITSAAEADGESATDSEDVWAEFFDEYENLSFTEQTTDEHYQAEYDALTLPMAVTTQAVAGTTKLQTTTNAAVRETTTEFRFTSPSRSASTTVKDQTGSTTEKANESTSAANESTTAEQTTSTTDETTMLADLAAGIQGAQDVSVVTRPQVTYLDKYVTNILNTNVYTMETETKQDGKTIPVTVFQNGNNHEVDVTLTSYLTQNMDIPAAFANLGKLRIIVKDKKMYIAWTGGYCEMSESEEFADTLSDMTNDQDLSNLSQILTNSLEYCGYSTMRGVLCETYKSTEENLQYNFYFTTVDDYKGIVRWDIVNLTTGQTEQQMVIRLHDKITDKKAFTVSGKKYTMAEVEKLFGG